MVIYIVGNKVDMPTEEIKVSLKQAREKYVIVSYKLSIYLEQ